MIEVVVAGELYADLIMGGFDFWPQPGQEAFAKEFRREIGGGAAITACGLATLGTATTLFGIVGSDSQAWIAERLAARGVDTALLRTNANEPTAFTVAVSTPHDRAFFTYLGANKGSRAWPKLRRPCYLPARAISTWRTRRHGTPRIACSMPFTATDARSHWTQAGTKIGWPTRARLAYCKRSTSSSPMKTKLHA
jgi:hypothetical protein